MTASDTAAPSEVLLRLPSADGLTKDPSPPSRDRGTRIRVVRLHAALCAVLTTAVAVAPRMLHHRNAPARVHVVVDSVVGGWLRWDGWWYTAIAEHGYTYRPHHMSAVAFFPVYPAIIRAVGTAIPGGVPFAAIVTTAVSGAIALVLLHRWCARRLSPRAANLAVIAMAVYPFAWFLYGAAYSDALYLALVLAAFLLLEDDHLVGVAIVGAIATATRPTGITLLIGLVAVAFDRPRGPRRTRAVAAATAAAAGLGLWCTWLAVRFHNPLAFIETEGAPGWNQPPGVRTWLKLDLLTKLGRLPTPEAIAIVVQVVMAIAFIAVLPRVRRAFGRGYCVYAAAAVLVPTLSTGDFLGVGRYLLAAFPVFAVAGLSFASTRPHRRVLAAGTSVALLLAGTALFSAGYLVS